MFAEAAVDFIRGHDGRRPFFACVVRTPMIVTGRGVPRGRSTQAFTYIHDLFPTS